MVKVNERATTIDGVVLVGVIRRIESNVARNCCGHKFSCILEVNVVVSHAVNDI